MNFGYFSSNFMVAVVILTMRIWRGKKIKTKRFIIVIVIIIIFEPRPEKNQHICSKLSPFPFVSM